MNSDKAAVLIDGGYLDKALSEIGIRILFDKFSDKLCQESGEAYRLRTLYYNCLPYQSDPPTEDEKRRYQDAQRFTYALSRLPRFQVRLGKLQKIQDPTSPDGFEYRQKRVDVLFAVDLVRMSTERQIQKAILVTGDSDVVPAVDVARDRGVEVWLWYCDSSGSRVHDELITACDERRKITRDLCREVSR
jgi:uncharacterized LabA/DUF88 family protein